MKIIEYKIVEERDVAALIKEGWQPFGSPVFVNEGPMENLFFVAMVKYELPSTRGHHPKYDEALTLSGRNTIVGRNAKG